MTPRRWRPAAIRQAEADWRDAKDGVRRHRKICSRCHQAIAADQSASTCDEGWAWVKLERITAAQLRATEADVAAAAPVQGVLF